MAYLACKMASGTAPLPLLWGVDFMKTSCSFDLPDFADYPEFHRFIAAWESWRGLRKVPRRSDVRLEQIQSGLPNTAIFDMCSHTDIRCRYVGSAFTDIYGHDYTGKNYLELTEPHDREARSARMFSVVEQPCIGAWAVTANAPEDNELTTVGISVPIRSDDQTEPSQVMQVMKVFTPVPNLLFEKHEGEVMVHFASSFIPIDVGFGIPELP